ncbi:hypothetical protein YC2023_103287 [Brassica napus]
MAFDFDLNVSVQNYESGNLFDLNTIPSEEEEEQSVNNSYEVILPFSSVQGKPLICDGKTPTVTSNSYTQTLTFQILPPSNRRLATSRKRKFDDQNHCIARNPNLNSSPNNKKKGFKMTPQRFSI